MLVAAILSRVKDLVIIDPPQQAPKLPQVLRLLNDVIRTYVCARTPSTGAAQQHARCRQVEAAQQHSTAKMHLSLARPNGSSSPPRHVPCVRHATHSGRMSPTRRAGSTAVSAAPVAAPFAAPGLSPSQQQVINLVHQVMAQQQKTLEEAVPLVAHMLRVPVPSVANLVVAQNQHFVVQQHLARGLPLMPFLQPAMQSMQQQSALQASQYRAGLSRADTNRAGFKGPCGSRCE